MQNLWHGKFWKSTKHTQKQEGWIKSIPKGIFCVAKLSYTQKKAIASYDTVEGNQVLRENKWKLDKLTFHYHTIC
jgi:hypothetical protein